MNHPGLLAEYVAVPAGFAWPAPDTVVLEDLVCTEALTVARAAIRRSGVEPGQRALVVGAGSQGLLLCLALVALGVSVAVREPHVGRVELAHSFGAENHVEGEFDVVFETSGATLALRGAGWSGCVVAAPRCSSASARNRSTFPVRTSSTPRHTLRGSLIYDHPVDFRTTVDLLGRGEVSPGKVLQARFPLAQAFASVDSVAGKSWISFD